MALITHHEGNTAPATTYFIFPANCSFTEKLLIMVAEKGADSDEETPEPRIPRFAEAPRGGRPPSLLQ